MAPKTLLVEVLSGQKVLDLPKVLKKALSPATIALLFAIGGEAERQRAPLYLVGGFVRDLLLQRPNLDLDLVIEGDAIQLGRTLQKRFGGRLTPHQSFGTAVWWLPEDKKKLLRNIGSASKQKSSPQFPEFIDLVSARQESYRRPGSLPDVKFADIRADQYRRDFTINALALCLTGLRAGQLLDPWDGLRDLHRGLLRVLHSKSFSDDPTRILRAVRFAARLKFKIEPSTLKQLKSSLRFMNQISGERIRRELELALEEEKRVQVLQQMQKLGVLKSIHAGLKWQSAMGALLRRLIPSSALQVWGLENVPFTDISFVLWFVQLPASVIAAITDRLRFTADMRGAAVAAARLRASEPSLKKLSTSRLVSALEREPLISVFALYLLNSNNKFGQKLQRYAKEWRHIRSHLDGNDLKNLGLKPGPDYRNILERLRSARLDGEVKNVAQEKALLKKVING
jgi:tRNA nucleotidyltransferase (CCA-adding enzyme)